MDGGSWESKEIRSPSCPLVDFQNCCKIKVRGLSLSEVQRFSDYTDLGLFISEQRLVLRGSSVWSSFSYLRGNWEAVQSAWSSDSVKEWPGPIG